MNKKQSILIWFAVFVLLSLGTLSVFAQDAATPAPVAETTAGDAEATPEPTSAPTHRIVTETVEIVDSVVVTDAQGTTYTIPVTRTQVITRSEPIPPRTKVLTETVVITHADGNISTITFTRTVPFIEEGQQTRLFTRTMRITDTNGVGVNVDVWIEEPIPTPTPVPTAIPTATPWPTSSWQPSPTPSWRPTATPTPEPVIPWRGQYWANPEFVGQPVRSRNDDKIDFYWGTGTAFWGAMPNDYYAARWVKNEPDVQRGFYRVTAVSDYGMRFYVNGQPVIDEIRNFNTAPRTAYFWSNGDSGLNYRYEYFHHVGTATARLEVAYAGLDISPFGQATVVNGAPVLRDGPGTQYDGNGFAATNSTVALTGHRNVASNWVCIVTGDGEIGWVNTYYLQSNVNFAQRLEVWPLWIDNNEPTATIAPMPNGFVNMRYSPGPANGVISQANSGTRVVLVGRSSSNNWVLIRMWDGTIGWVPAATLVTNYPLNSLPVRYVNTTVVE